MWCESFMRVGSNRLEQLTDGKGVAEFGGLVQ